MPQFGTDSKAALATCRPELQEVFNEVIKHFDCKVTEGFRDQAAQHAAFLAGKSKKDWPDGRHNRMPSDAADVVPYPVEWQDRERFALFAGFVLAVAAMKGHRLTWGGDWNNNHETDDERFSDMPHFQYEGHLTA